MKNAMLYYHTDIKSLTWSYLPECSSYDSACDIYMFKNKLARNSRHSGPSPWRRYPVPYRCGFWHSIPWLSCSVTQTVAKLDQSLESFLLCPKEIINEILLRRIDIFVVIDWR